MAYWFCRSDLGGDVAGGGWRVLLSVHSALQAAAPSRFFCRWSGLSCQLRCVSFRGPSIVALSSVAPSDCFGTRPSPCEEQFRWQICVAVQWYRQGTGCGFFVNESGFGSPCPRSVEPRPVRERLPVERRMQIKRLSTNIFPLSSSGSAWSRTVVRLLA